MTHYAYIFEANSIQRYILASGKLKECVGASEMLVALTDSVLDSFLKEFQLGDEVTFSRRAGGAIYAFASEQSHIDTMSSVWPLIVRQFMPGLPFTQSVGSGALEKDAFANARAAMVSDRNHAVVAVPGISPAIALAPRTGRPASSDPDKNDNLVDISSHKKAEFSIYKSLTKRFYALDDHHWPIDLHARGSARPRRRNTQEENLTEFPFQYPGQYLAIVHIDGNSLGQRLLDLNDLAGKSANVSYVNCFKQFSEAIEESTAAAAAAATTEILLPSSDQYVVPARPIVLGGDDMTVIVRADLALEFVIAFLKHFELETHARLEPLGLDGMTACAGIAYVKSTYPFHLAHEIAESLCDKAKRYSKQLKSVPSSLCFSRLTNSLGDEDPAVHSSLGAYVLTASSTLPALPAIDHLLDLVKWVSEAKASSRFRALLGLAASEKRDLRSDYERWRALTLQREDRDERGPRKGGAVATLEAFDRLLEKVDPLSRPKESDSTRFAALSDLMTLVAVNNMAPKRQIDSRQTTGANMEIRHA